MSRVEVDVDFLPLNCPYCGSEDIEWDKDMVINGGEDGACSRRVDGECGGCGAEGVCISLLVTCPCLGHVLYSWRYSFTSVSVPSTMSTSTDANFPDIAVTATLIRANIEI